MPKKSVKKINMGGALKKDKAMEGRKPAKPKKQKFRDPVKTPGFKFGKGTI